MDNLVQEFSRPQLTRKNKHGHDQCGESIDKEIVDDNEGREIDLRNPPG